MPKLYQGTPLYAVEGCARSFPPHHIRTFETPFREEEDPGSAKVVKLLETNNGYNYRVQPVVPDNNQFRPVRNGSECHVDTSHVNGGTWAS